MQLTRNGWIWRLFRSGPALALLLLCRCAWAVFPFGSSYNVQCDFWQTSDGLPYHDVVSLAQTPDGFIWIGMVGASNSVARFNGFEFAPSASQEDCGPKSSTSLAVGRDGTLWVSKPSRTGALALWRGNTATEIQLRHPQDANREYRGVQSYPLHEDRDHNLWVGGASLLVRAPDGRIEDLSAATRGFGYISQIVEDREGTIWLATVHGLVRYKNHAFDQPCPITNLLTSAFFSKDDSLWVGTDTEPGLIQITPSGLVRPYGPAQGLASKGVLAICEDRESRLWLGTFSGLYYMSEGKVYPIQDTDLRTAFIFSVLWDREGSLWVGTSDGLYHLYANPIEYYGGSSGLGPVNSLSIGPSGVWANVFSRGTFLFQQGIWTKRVNLSGSSGDGQLFEAANGDLWVSEESGYRHFTHQQPVVAEALGENACFCDDGKTLWIAGATNLFAFKEGKLSPLDKGWPATVIYGIVTNQPQGVLIGTSQGLCKWDGQLTRWLNFGSDFPGSRISGLEWGGSQLWVASDQTIACYSNGWRVIRAEAGLARTGGINSMLVEADSLWLGCVNGLFCLSRTEANQYLNGAPGQITLTQYGKGQGLRSGYLGASSFGSGAVRGNDGKLWFASKSGIVGVNTRELLSRQPPSVVIENVLLDQQSAAAFPVLSNQVIQVPAGTRNVEIHYAAVTYISPTMVIYKYRLQGLDPDWVIADNGRVARFTKLPPGDYEFQVQARNAAGAWNEEPATLRIAQIPFFRQTRAFLILCWSLGFCAILALAILGSVTVHAISSRKMRRRLALLEAQQALDRERSRIARDIHDDVGSTLTRIVLLSELAYREPEKTYTPDGHLAAIRSAAREITRRLDETVWAINPRNDTLDSLVTYISKLIVDQARAAGFHCHLDVPPSIPSWPMTGTTRHNIFLACKEAIHNAVQHSGAKQLQLRLTLREEDFLLEICDDGVGLPASPSQPGGDGLLNMRERLAHLGGACEITSSPGRGTTVGFRLPFSPAPKSLSPK
jgi:signal transduction histidine kinase/ligand-binding sensor domain-containing protein